MYLLLKLNTIMTINIVPPKDKSKLSKMVSIKCKNRRSEMASISADLYEWGCLALFYFSMVQMTLH